MRTLFMLLLSALFVPVGANAAVIEFTDNTTYMPTWESRYYSENLVDTIANPDFSGGRLYLEGNSLTGVQLDFTADHWDAGDLFIDKDDNGYFDYVLNVESSYVYSFADHVLSSAKGDNNHLYVTSNQNYPYRYPNEIRHDHFVSLNPSAVRELSNDDVQILGQFRYRAGSNLLVFDDFSLDLEMGGDFSFVYSPTCANDVISHTAPVPLPGSFVLLSAGLCALMGARRKVQRR